AVDMPVGNVVPRAPGTAHQNRANSAADKNPQVHPARLPVVQYSQRQPPPARQQQQPCSDGPVSTRQAQIRARGDRRIPIHPITANRVGNAAFALWSLRWLGHMVPLMSAAKIRLYVEQPLGQGQTVTLDRDQAHYLFGVMRLGVGAQVA